MLRIYTTVAIAIIAVSAHAQETAQTTTTPIQGPDFGGLLSDIQFNRDIPAPDLVLTAPTWRWGDRVTYFDNQPNQHFPTPENLAEYTVDQRDSTTIEPTPTPADDELLLIPWVININKISAMELASVPLLDPIRAQSIVDFRRHNGPFESPNQLMDVFGISTPIYQALAPHLRCDGPTTFSAASTVSLPELVEEPTRQEEQSS